MSKNVRSLWYVNLDDGFIALDKAIDQYMHERGTKPVVLISHGTITTLQPTISSGRAGWVFVYNGCRVFEDATQDFGVAELR